MEQYLDEFDDIVSNRRNATELSKFSEALIMTFIKNKATRASVRVSETPYELETLYKSLYNISRKSGFMGLVRVHKQDEQIILLRIK